MCLSDSPILDSPILESSSNGIIHIPTQEVGSVQGISLLENSPSLESSPNVIIRIPVQEVGSVPGIIPLLDNSPSPEGGSKDSIDELLSSSSSKDDTPPSSKKFCNQSVESTKEFSDNVDKEYEVEEGSYYLLFRSTQMTDLNCHHLFAIIENCGEYYGKEGVDITGKLSHL